MKLMRFDNRITMFKNKRKQSGEKNEIQKNIKF